MHLRLPDDLDDSVRGLSVTYWIDRSQKWLLQYSNDEPLPCFGQIDGIRRKFAIPFDPAVLYRKCAICLTSATLPVARSTECPSLMIGLSVRSFNVHTDLPADKEGLRSVGASELVNYLMSVIADATEIVA